jgi:glycosyltransferase involved in cell wall biosynthesis
MATTSIKILHVFSTFNIGGTEVRTCDLINNLGNNFSHTIRILKHGSSAAALIKNSSEVKFIEDSFPTSFFKAILTARKELNHINPDLVITYSWGAIEWVICHAIFRSTPLIHIEDGFTDETPSKQKKIRLLIRKLFFRQSSKVVVPAIVLKNVAKKMWSVPEKKIEYIPNGVNTERFKPFENKMHNTTCILSIIGTLYAVKNHKKLLSIISKIPSDIGVELWITGSGPDEISLKKFCTDLNICQKVKFLGQRNDTDEILRQTDIFCLSSDHEQMPITVLEAMATALPVISTDVGDVKEMVADENKNFIIAPGNVNEYMKKLLSLITNPSLRARIGATNRDRCCNIYSNHKMYQKYSTLFTDLTKR